MDFLLANYNTLDMTAKGDINSQRMMWFVLCVPQINKILFTFAELSLPQSAFFIESQTGQS
jgi:hypothetical protein